MNRRTSLSLSPVAFSSIAKLIEIFGFDTNKSAKQETSLPLRSIVPSPLTSVWRIWEKQSPSTSVLSSILSSPGLGFGSDLWSTSAHSIAERVWVISRLEVIGRQKVGETLTCLSPTARYEIFSLRPPHPSSSLITNILSSHLRAIGSIIYCARLRIVHYVLKDLSPNIPIRRLPSISSSPKVIDLKRQQLSSRILDLKARVLSQK